MVVPQFEIQMPSLEEMASLLNLKLRDFNGKFKIKAPVLRGVLLPLINVSISLDIYRGGSSGGGGVHPAFAVERIGIRKGGCIRGRVNDFGVSEVYIRLSGKRLAETPVIFCR